ncbi:glycosyltransferase family 9 protein [Rhodanobacter denitrificans]|uniref:glycosyltransferase family 9 protein n=1 Tax=Rhodanobacter denitrificans TaxID=666685 RepID=UPI000A5E990A|nr:glycosyltransferase family 9 protein [Rhodanobacter denitrificans]UJM90318.1 glycosyltransferase family 9 protein [Rhodanobacter denitrificans]
MTPSETPLAAIAPTVVGRDAWPTHRHLLGVGELPRRDVFRILLLRPNHRLGNTLLLTPLLSELERRYPGAEIDLVTGCEAADEVFAGFRQVRHIFQLTRRPGHHPLRLLRTLLRLRRARYDLAIDGTRGSRSGRLLLFLSGARHLLGLPGSKRELREGGSAWKTALAHAPDHFSLDGVYALRCAMGLSFPEQEESWPPLRIHLGAEELASGRALLLDLLGYEPDGNHRVIALFPNATGSKRLCSEWWLALVDALTTAHPELRFIEMLPAHGQSQLQSRFPAFYSSNVRRMAAVLAQCDGYISADCGVMHLACAAGVPTLGLFTRDNLTRYRPRGQHDEALCVAGLTPVQVAAAAAPFVHALQR